MSGSSLTYKNFADTTLLTIANDGSTTFAGKISTPSWSSTDGVSIDHNNTLNIQGGSSNQYYHLTENEHTYLTSFLENGSNSLTTNTIYNTNYNIGANVLTYSEDVVDGSGNIGTTLYTNIHGGTILTLFTMKNIGNLNIGQQANINANLYVNGVITTPSWSSSGGLNTITHVTQSTDSTLEEGIFVETTGENYYEPDFIDENGVSITKNPYENCFCKVKRANSLNKNIVGVLTSINPASEAGTNVPRLVKFATHGDVLIKVISDTYNLGDNLIPTVDGYGKKATSGEIYDSLFMMIPRAKITALVTDIPNTVSAILL